MPATIVDIKEKTGLSLATISKYLNGGNVLPENRIKIEAAIKELSERGSLTGKLSSKEISEVIGDSYNISQLSDICDALENGSCDEFRRVLTEHFAPYTNW